MITQEFNLNLHAGHSIPLVINVSQYEKNEQWVFTLFNSDGTQYRPASASIVGTKSDGNLINNEATVDSDGRVVVEVTDQIAAAAGKAVFELRLDNQTHGTANFVVLVEKSPADEGIPSESDLSLFQEAINSIAIAGSGAPAVATTASEMIDTGKIYLYAGSETGYTAGDWYYYNGSAWVDGGKYGGTVDATLTKSGQAADAKKTGDEISDLKSQITQSTGMSAEFKVALENLVNQVVFKGDDPTGRTYINALHTAMYPPANLTSISAVYKQSSTVYSTDSLDSLKSDLVVTAHYDNGTSETVTTYALSGTLAEGTTAITVTYGGKTTTFDVTVTGVIQYTFATTGETVTITGGNHFKIDFKGVTTATGGMINLSELILNGASTTSNNSAVNNRSESWLTIPAGASATLEISNMSLTAGELLKNDAHYAKFLVNARKQNTSTSIFDAIGYTSPSASNLSSTKTFSVETIASNLFVYFGYEKEVSFEFDLSLKVNGVEMLK